VASMPDDNFVLLHTTRDATEIDNDSTRLKPECGTRPRLYV
jgi:hypothetical protein